MKGLFLILFLFPVVYLLHAQKTNLLWVKQMGGTDVADARGLSIATDDSGNVYTTGFFSGDVDFDPGPGVHNLHPRGIEDAFICKLDSSGKFQWARQVVAGDGANYVKGKSIAIDADGNIIITGSYSQDFGIGTCYVIKFNSAGNIIWTRELESSEGNSIKVDDFNNVFTAGRIGLPYGQAGIFLCKFAANGELAWTRQLGGGVGVSIALDAAGDIYISGSFGGIQDFDPGSGVYYLSGFGFSDIFILKLDRNGEFVWAKQMGGADDDVGVSVVADFPGNVYVAGNFKGKADFDPGPGTHNLVIIDSISNSFISKLDPNGNFLWAKHLKGDWQWCYSSALDGDGNLYTTGYFGKTLDFDPGPGSYNLSTSGFDIFISKLNSNGDFIWAKQMGGTARVICNSITVDAAGTIYTTGYFFNGKVDFDPGPDSFYIHSGDAENLYVHKMGQCFGNTSSFITASACNKYILNGATYNTSGLYTQYLTNAAGCDSILTLELSINTLHKLVNISTCDSYTMNNHTYNASGTYSDTLIATNGCDSIVTLNLTITPPYTTNVSRSICAGQSYNGYTVAGTYNDTLVTGNGCDSIVTLQLTILTGPSPFLGADTSLCARDSLVLYPGKFNTYLWQDGSIQDRLAVIKPGVYSVTVTDSCGSATDEIIIAGQQVCDIYFPKAFTPNNDGLNDLFRILGANNISDFRLTIYNRWGQKVFETFDYAKGWNGNVNGHQQPAQTYVWHCEYRIRGNSKRITSEGMVTLVR